MPRVSKKVAATVEPEQQNQATTESAFTPVDDLRVLAEPTTTDEATEQKLCVAKCGRPAPWGDYCKECFDDRKIPCIDCGSKINPIEGFAADKTRCWNCNKRKKAQVAQVDPEAVTKTRNFAKGLVERLERESAEFDLTAAKRLLTLARIEFAKGVSFEARNLYQGAIDAARLAVATHMGTVKIPELLQEFEGFFAPLQTAAAADGLQNAFDEVFNDVVRGAQGNADEFGIREDLYKLAPDKVEEIMRERFHNLEQFFAETKERALRWSDE